MADGDHWVVDPVGGNLNLVHGIADWNIGVSLVRDGRPALAVLYAPLSDEMFTATDGGGAFRNGGRLAVSAKTDLAVALTGTGQARPGHSADVARRVGASIAAMQQTALYVRSSVPVGRELAQVAAGRLDAHWQFENVRSHIGPVLLVREAGGTVTDFGVARVIWLGALGTGPSAGAAGMLTRTMLGVFLGSELPDKVAADATIIAAGGTVFHVGPMNAGPAAPDRRTLTLGQAPRRLFPRGASRATVAAEMVAEAVRAQHPGQTVTVVG